MTLYGFYRNSLAYIYDLLVLDGIKCTVISRTANSCTNVPKGVLLFDNVKTIISWLPLLNSVDNIVCVFDAEENLQMIKNIHLIEDNKSNITSKDINKRNEILVYTYAKKDIIDSLIRDSVQGSLMIKLNPILYKSTTKLEQRNTILKEVCNYIFEHEDLNKLKTNLAPFSINNKNKLNKKFEDLYNFIEKNPDIIKAALKAKSKKCNWEQIRKEYPDVKVFELRYLLKTYERKTV